MNPLDVHGAVRGHPWFQKHYRGTRMILAIKVYYSQPLTHGPVNVGYNANSETCFIIIWAAMLLLSSQFLESCGTIQMCH